MKHIKLFEDFLMENDISPEAKIALSIKATQDKIAALKQEMSDKPEMREFIVAKINVETQKLDVILANKQLLAAKEKEAIRKAKEKAEKNKK